MTNAHVRIQRNGVYVSVEIETLSDAELQEYFNGDGERQAKQWAITLAAWIRDNVKSWEDDLDADDTAKASGKR